MKIFQHFCTVSLLRIKKTFTGCTPPIRRTLNLRHQSYLSRRGLLLGGHFKRHTSLELMIPALFRNESTLNYLVTENQANRTEELSKRAARPPENRRLFRASMGNDVGPCPPSEIDPFPRHLTPIHAIKIPPRASIVSALYFHGILLKFHHYHSTYSQAN